jgi:hypothetical protein
MIARAKAAFSQGQLLHEFIPCPQVLIDTVAGSVGREGDPAQVALEQQRADNIVNYGHADWYSWRVEHWGTKWDIGDDGTIDDFGDSVTFAFDSAWSPPIEAYAVLQELGFDVHALYSESGMCFCGSWINGEDRYVEYPSTYDEAVKLVPEDIEKVFGICDMIAQWEAEEQEE